MLAETIYRAKTKAELDPGYTVLQNMGIPGSITFFKGWLARRLMEVERQTLRSKEVVEYAKDPTAPAFVNHYDRYMEKRLDYAINQLKGMFEDHGREMESFAVLSEHKYGFRVRLKGYRVVRYIRRHRGAAWVSHENNVPIVLVFTDQVLSTPLARTEPIRALPARPAAH